MIKVNFLSKSLKKYFSKTFFNKEIHTLNNKLRPMSYLPKKFFSEENKNVDTSKEKLMDLKLDNLEKKSSFDNIKKEQIQNEELIRNIEIDTRLEAIRLNTEESKKENMDINSNASNNKNNKSKNEEKSEKENTNKISADEEIEAMRKLLSEFYDSKMSYKEYLKIANEYKQMLYAEFVVFLISNLFY